jgi:hypothetical protein
MPRIRMCDADRERYGGPEWVEVAIADIVNEETGLVEAVEEAFGLSPAEFLSRIGRGSIKAYRAMIWLARRKAGCVDDPRRFRPLTQVWSGITYELLGGEQAEEVPLANRATRRAAAAPKKATSPRKTGTTARSARSSTGTGSGSPDS